MPYHSKTDIGSLDPVISAAQMTAVDWIAIEITGLNLVQIIGKMPERVWPNWRCKSWVSSGNA